MYYITKLIFVETLIYIRLKGSWFAKHFGLNPMSVGEMSKPWHTNSSVYAHVKCKVNKGVSTATLVCT